MTEKKANLLELFRIERSDSAQKIADKVRSISKDKFDEETLVKLIDKVIAENDKRILEEMVTGVKFDIPFSSSTSSNQLQFEEESEVEEATAKRYVGPKQVKRRKLNTKAIAVAIAGVVTLVAIVFGIRAFFSSSSNKLNLGNKELESIVSTYMSEKKMDISSIDKIISIVITDKEFKVNGDKITHTQTTNDLELKGLEKLKGLKEFSVSKTYTSVIFNIDTNNEIIESLSIEGIDIKDSNIETIKYLINLQSLRVNDSNLVDINSIESLTKLKELHLSNNDIVDIAAIEKMQVDKVNVFGNKISNYRVLKNVSEINVWDGTVEYYNYEKMPALTVAGIENNAENVVVIVSELRVRTQPNTNGSVIDFAKEGAYYIFDEFTDTTTNTKWFKISSDGWVATSQNQWTDYNE